MGVFWLFLLATALGSLSTLFWIPEDDLGRGYFQTNALVILGLLGLAVAVLILHPFEPFGSSALAGTIAVGTALGASFLYYFAVMKESWRVGRYPLAVAFLANAGALVLSGPAAAPLRAALPGRSTLVVLALLASALVLGWSLIAMLLGHWYLVAPKLTFRHLVIFCQVLAVTVGLRLLTVGASLVSAATVDALVDPHPLRLLTSFGGQGMFFWFRVLWGLAVPLVLSLMALHCARHRSNQSATGILYVVLVGVFIGEVTAFYLMATTGVPV